MPRPPPPQIIDMGGMIMGSSGAYGSEETPEAESFNLADLEQSRAEDGAFVLGDPDAPITIVEFADWACPHCQSYKTTIEQLIETYVAEGLARFEFRMFPTMGGQLTYYAGRLAECVADAHANDETAATFWDVYSFFYELAEAGRFNESLARYVAREFELNETTLSECALAEGEMQIDVDMQAGSDVGISGTPAVLVRYGTLEEGGEMEYIELNDTIYNRGGVDFDILAAVIEIALQGEK